MTTITHRQMKRYHIENELTYPISRSIKQKLISRDWSLQNSKKFKKVMKRKKNNNIIVKFI